MVVSLKDFVKVYPGALDTNLCRNIIDLASKTEPERWEQKGRPQWNMWNLPMMAEEDKIEVWQNVHNQFVTAIKSTAEQYMTDVQCRDYWPPQNALEQIRLKHYDHEKNDRYDWHVDVGNHDSARRFLAMFFYLNDVEKGGQTYFNNINYKVKAKQGSVLCFPPTWMFPHEGKAPLSGDKWIVGTYLHYL